MQAFKINIVILDAAVLKGLQPSQCEMCEQEANQAAT